MPACYLLAMLLHRRMQLIVHKIQFSGRNLELSLLFSHLCFRVHLTAGERFSIWQKSRAAFALFSFTVVALTFWHSLQNCCKLSSPDLTAGYTDTPKAMPDLSEEFLIAVVAALTNPRSRLHVVVCVSQDP